MNLFRRAHVPGDLLAIHQRGDAPSVRGSFVECTRQHWVLNRHSVDVDGVYVESRYELVLVPRANVTLVEVQRR